MASEGKALLLAVLALVGGFAGGYYWGRSLSPEGVSSSTQKLLLAEAENQLLRQMLGQIPARVVLLGPAESGKAAYGKLVWDESRQAGLLYLKDMPELPENGFHVLVLEKSGKRLAEVLLEKRTGPESWFRIQPPQRVLGAETFKIVLKNTVSPEDGGRVVLKGL